MSPIAPSPPKILVAICSATHYRTRRDAVRKSWLAQSVEGITPLFFVGQGPPLENEPDTVMLEVSDTYDDLPAKVQRLFAHALANFEFDWLFKCDDDTYVCLPHLHELITEGFDLVGNEAFLKERGYASGGAGYLLSRRYVSILAEDVELPQNGCEDIIITTAAQRHGAMAFPSPRLNWTNQPTPSKANRLITSHWCTPQKLHAIHTRLYDTPQRKSKATHPHWEDSMAFYENGVFVRETTGCSGHWAPRGDGRLRLKWFDWDEEIANFPPVLDLAKGPSIHLTKPISNVRHVVAKLVGGLGNQMFQYAASLTMAEALQAELHLTWAGWDRRYMLDIFGLELSGTAPEGQLFHDPSSYSHGMEKRLLQSLIQSKSEAVTLQGYFQNESFFASVADQVRRRFALTATLPETVGTGTPVAVHVRRGDYVGGASHDVCSLAYFRSGMQILRGLIAQPVFLIFSDDPGWCRAIMGHWPDVQVLPPLTEIETYRMMAACQAFVLSNSTFSWWAAWLNNSPYVIRPSRALNDRPWDLWPERWISLPAEGLPETSALAAPSLVTRPRSYRKPSHRSTPEVAFVILNHEKPGRLQRLTQTLNELYDRPSLICHHDFSHCPLDEADFVSNLQFVKPHVPTSWGAFSLVEATLAALDALLPLEPQWVFLISGADYPIRPAADVMQELHAGGYDAWMHLERIRPNAFERPWQATAYERYFPDGQFPAGMACYAGSQWMTLSLAAVRRLLETHRQSPALATHFARCPIPDESYFHTILGNDSSLRISPQNRRYVDWNLHQGPGPKVLTMEDYPALIQSGDHFARKLDPEVDSTVIGKLDAYLMKAHAIS